MVATRLSFADCCRIQRGPPLGLPEEPWHKVPPHPVPVLTPGTGTPRKTEVFRCISPGPGFAPYSSLRMEVEETEGEGGGGGGRGGGEGGGEGHRFLMVPALMTAVSPGALGS